MAATTAIRHNPDWVVVYPRLTQAGKLHTVVLVAVMGKLIVLANALLRGERSWTVTAPAI